MHWGLKGHLLTPPPPPPTKLFCKLYHHTFSRTTFLWLFFFKVYRYFDTMFVKIGHDLLSPEDSLLFYFFIFSHLLCPKQMAKCGFYFGLEISTCYEAICVIAFKFWKGLLWFCSQIECKDNEYSLLWCNLGHFVKSAQYSWMTPLFHITTYFRCRPHRFPRYSPWILGMNCTRWSAQGASFSSAKCPLDLEWRV